MRNRSGRAVPGRRQRVPARTGHVHGRAGTGLSLLHPGLGLPRLRPCRWHPGRGGPGLGPGRTAGLGTLRLRGGGPDAPGFGQPLAEDPCNRADVGTLRGHVPVPARPEPWDDPGGPLQARGRGPHRAGYGRRLASGRSGVRTVVGAEHDAVTASASTFRSIYSPKGGQGVLPGNF